MSVTLVEGNMEGRNLKMAIVVSRFNEYVTERLLEGALSELQRFGVSEDRITVFKVPGAFEIPVTVRKVSDLGRYDGIICLGAVIRGETPHFDYICSSVLPLLAQLSKETGIPITNGIITADTVEQAMNRAGLKHGNLGSSAARTALEVANLFKRIES